MKKDYTTKGLQQKLFEEIQKTLPGNYTLVDSIAELLGISTDSAYRRIRCDKSLDIGEAGLLCAHFNISFDGLFLQSENRRGEISYRPLDLSNDKDYVVYIQTFLAGIEQFCKFPGSEIILSAVDIPMFAFLPYKELISFKLFSWMSTIYGLSDNYEHYAKLTETPELLGCYEKITKCYSRIPSAEIWTENTIDVFLDLVGHHYEIGHFADKKTPLMLCAQLLSLTDTLQEWTAKGYKCDMPDSTFKLYVSDIHLENTFVLLKKSNSLHCILKLFTINSLSISEERLCGEVEKWLKASIRRSVLISGASERKQYRFFSLQKQKIRFLIDRIQHDRDDSWKGEQL